MQLFCGLRTVGVSKSDYEVLVIRDATTHICVFDITRHSGTQRHEPSVWVANGVGILFSFFYFTQFLKYSPKNPPLCRGQRTCTFELVLPLCLQSRPLQCCYQRITLLH